MNWTPEKLASARKLRAKGYTWGQVAEGFGCSPAAVSKAVQRSGGMPRQDAAEGLKAAEARVRDLERTLAMATESLAAARGQKRVPISPKRGKSRSGDFCRVVITDVHGCFMDRPAVEACLADIRSLDPAEVIILGDVIDCGGFLAQHHTWGYVAEADYSFEEDVSAANGFLDALQSAAPRAEIHFLEGNHERRIETWCLTEALRSKRDAQYLLGFLAVEKQLHLSERGIAYYKQGEFYDGLGKPNTIRRGLCFFTHGEKAGVNACRDTLNEFAFNVQFGHTHTPGESSRRTVQHGEIKAWNPGGLCRLQPLWNHGRLTNWAHGFGVDFVSKRSGRFQHLNVSIVNGESMLGPFTARLK